MATLAVVFPFSSNSQGFVFTGSVTPKFSGIWESSGGNPGGCLQVQLNQAGSNFAYWSLTTTYAALGIPPTATVIAINALTCDIMGTLTSGTSLAFGSNGNPITDATFQGMAVEDVISGQYVWMLQTNVPGGGLPTTSFPWTTVTGNSAAISGIASNSSGNLTIWIGAELNSGGNTIQGFFDNIGFAITYETFTTLDPLNTAAGLTLSNGNLTVKETGSNISQGSRAIDAKTTGKFYFEAKWSTINGIEAIGVSNASWSTASNMRTSASISCESGTAIFGNGGQINGFSPTWTTGDTVCVAVDVGAKLFWMRVNGGSWFGSGNGTGNPATGTAGASFSYLTGAVYPSYTSNRTNDQGTVNFGSSAFAQTPPSGFAGWQISIPVSQSEFGTLTDNLTANFITRPSVTETGTLVDTDTGGLVARPSDNEIGHLADSLDAVAIINQHETGSLVDTNSVQWNALASFTETATTTDHISFEINGSASETGNLVDNPDGKAILNVTDFITADESADALVLPLGIVTDTLTIQDTEDSTHNTFRPTISEAGSLTDSTTATITGIIFNESVTTTDQSFITTTTSNITVFEPLTALDTSNGATNFHIECDEAVSTHDTIDGVVGFFLETAALNAQENATVNYAAVSVIERIDTQDIQADPVIGLEANESSSLTEVTDANANYGGSGLSVNEIMTPIDFVGLDVNIQIEASNLEDFNATFMRWGPRHFESMTADEAQEGRIFIPLAVNEAGHLIDTDDATSTTAIDNEATTSNDTTDAQVVAVLRVNESASLSDDIGRSDFTFTEMGNLLDKVYIVAVAIQQINQQPEIHFVSIHDAFTDRSSDPTNLHNGIFEKRPARSTPPSRPPRGPRIDLTPNLKFRSIHDAFTGRRSDPTDSDNK